MNCCVKPLAIEGFWGETAIETRAAGPMVTAVLPARPPDAAPIWDVPCAAPLTSPPEVIGATVESDELHVTELVRSCVPPSE